MEHGWIRDGIFVPPLPSPRHILTCPNVVKQSLPVVSSPMAKFYSSSGASIVSKAAIEPVWYLPEIARRFGCTESTLRQSIFRMTNGMYPELITRPDIKIFLPPIGNVTVYIWGDPDTIPDEGEQCMYRY